MIHLFNLLSPCYISWEVSPSFQNVEIDFIAIMFVHYLQSKCKKSQRCSRNYWKHIKIIVIVDSIVWKMSSHCAINLWAFFKSATNWRWRRPQKVHSCEFEMFLCIWFSLQFHAEKCSSTFMGQAQVAVLQCIDTTESHVICPFTIKISNKFSTFNRMRHPSSLMRCTIFAILCLHSAFNIQHSLWAQCEHIVASCFPVFFAFLFSFVVFQKCVFLNGRRHS